MSENISICLRKGGISVTLTIPIETDMNLIKDLCGGVLPIIEKSLYGNMDNAVPTDEDINNKTDSLMGSENQLVPEGWPERGAVTLAEIARLWRLGKSTFLRKVAGNISKATEYGN